MSYTLDNFVRSTLSADALSSDLTLSLAAAAAPLRDPPSGVTEDAPGIIVLQDLPSSPTVIEIVTFTGVATSGSTVTLSGCTRGCEGTTAQAWVSGTPTFQGITADVLAKLGGTPVDGAAGVTITSTVPTDPGDLETGHMWLVV